MSKQDEHVTPMGQHLLHVEGDTLFFAARGLITAPDMQELLDKFVRIKREHGGLFVLYDGTLSTGLEGAARRLAANMRSDGVIADLRVAFGISFTARMLIGMIVRAQRILIRQDVPIHFFDKEQDARNFFETEREKIRREKGIKASL